MSLLELHSRPWAVFDPTDKNHRYWYYEFVEQGTWGRCPYRFVIPEGNNNLVTMIERKLIGYYITKEFKK